MSKEEPLWRLLDDSGHSDFKKAVSHNADHGKSFEHAYCGDRELYEWFIEGGRVSGTQTGAVLA